MHEDLRPGVDGRSRLFLSRLTFLTLKKKQSLKFSYVNFNAFAVRSSNYLIFLNWKIKMKHVGCFVLHGFAQKHSMEIILQCPAAYIHSRKQRKLVSI